MTENQPRSKLKRKKSSVEEIHTELFSKGTAKTNRRQAADRSVAPAEAWWSQEQLPAVENLWVLTLKSALPYLENQHWDPVPDLPHTSAVRPAAPKLDEQQWCGLSEDVAPFPEPAPPSPRTSLSSDPVSASRQDLSVQTKPGAEPPDRQQPHHSRQHHGGTTTSLQCLTKKPRLSPHSSGEAAPPASVGTEEGRNGGEQVEPPQTGSVSRQDLTNMKASDSRVSLQRKDENKEEMVEDEDVEEAQERFREDGGGGGRLQSCPMCLLVFPVGFTQMDCDGHLAQCLSEMNVDMTW
ncbi:hypothetical protein Q5P01_007103 [Channa striata]|uniref:UBZ2-type domain-containing protein n=1 Tax=Channa striata TaxID=64152 RepID=A0AA88SYB6_CHASR|nr:hypothetical protein Q5P01_007103 [Channa striata]